ncbi:hypothetical protein [Pseudoxanthomonas sp.]|jgi:hypothetical protein|nr:hypothetical protein [Pseudoxanthomonas sp.]
MVEMSMNDAANVRGGFPWLIGYALLAAATAAFAMVITGNGSKLLPWNWC